MKRFARFVIGLLILAGGIAFSMLLWVTRPQAEKADTEETLPLVEVLPVRYEEMSFDMPSQGLIEASRRTTLAAAAAGRVVEVHPLFDVGHRVDAGTWLVKIDAVDYRADLAAATATLADAETNLAEEQARAEQAKRDWDNLGRPGEPSELASRQPQLRGAEARVEAARTALRKAEGDLSDTVLTAPFDGIIAATSTEVGSYLTEGAAVAEIFETRYEVRLPLSVDQLPFLQTGENGNLLGEVVLLASVGGETKEYRGRIVRTEGEIDRSSRSAYVVAEVDGGSDGAQAHHRLRPGLFVQARIAGRTLPRCARIPFSAFVGLERVALVAPDNTLQFRDVTVVHRDEESVYISGGVEENSLVCLTELPARITGQKVVPRPVADGGDEEPAPQPAL
ncbi:MAG: efflux RND transporter periplasmic adaptor subunit [Verrucomicrobiaceae bacterium]|nr:efflux RND transporter periplasmic adaptor subunit [Verrucomicrobiaceae bacterium]